MSRFEFKIESANARTVNYGISRVILRLSAASQSKNSGGVNFEISS